MHGACQVFIALVKKAKYISYPVYLELQNYFKIHFIIPVAVGLGPV